MAGDSTTPSKRSRSSIRRRLFFVAATLAFLLTVVAGLLEIGARIVFRRSLDFSMEMWKYAVQLKVPDPELSFKHRPNSHAFLMGHDVSINADGLRDRPVPKPKPPGTYRVLLLGDSTAFGWGVAAEDTSAKLLESALNHARLDRDPRFEVWNAGVGNYNTVQEVTYYQRRGIRLEPDLVLLEYFINDAEPVPTENKGFLVDRSYAMSFLRSRFDATMRAIGLKPDWKNYYSALYSDSAPGWQRCAEMLKALVATTRARNTQLLVALLPELRRINDEYPFTEAHEKVKAVLRSVGVDAVELLDGLRGHGPESTLWVTPEDSHPSRKANLLVVEQLLPRVLDLARTSRSMVPK